jgi:hypothetical protein
MAENYCTIGLFAFAADRELFVVKIEIKLDPSD